MVTRHPDSLVSCFLSPNSAVSPLMQSQIFSASFTNTEGTVTSEGDAVLPAPAVHVSQHVLGA